MMGIGQAEHDDDAQQYLRRLLLANDGLTGDCGARLELPSWYNDQLFKRAQYYMRKYRFVMFCGMLYGLIALLALPNSRRILTCTGRSGTPERAYRRYLRTIFHMQAWYDNDPVGSLRNNKFWQSIRAVRQSHAHASQACAKLGVGKIAQRELALTQFGFIGFLVVGARRIQLEDVEFLEAIVHMWRVIGHLLGIKPEYNICSENLKETRQRMRLVMHKILRPALEIESTEFNRMTKAMLDGLWYVNIGISMPAQLYLTKRLANCEGYEYYTFDYKPEAKPGLRSKRLHYKDLAWLDRLTVFIGLFLITYCHKYSIVRWCHNFCISIMYFFMYYLPVLAIWKWGYKHAYVRIFVES